MQDQLALFSEATTEKPVKKASATDYFTAPEISFRGTRNFCLYQENSICVLSRLCRGEAKLIKPSHYGENTLDLIPMFGFNLENHFSC